MHQWVMLGKKGPPVGIWAWHNKRYEIGSSKGTVKDTSHRQLSVEMYSSRHKIKIILGQ